MTPITEPFPITLLEQLDYEYVYALGMALVGCKQS